MTMLLAAMLPLLAQDERSYQAKVLIEEGPRSGDSRSRTEGTAVVKPGESVVARLSGRRLVYRGGGLHPLDLWALGPAAWHERFEAVPEETPGERALPEGAAGVPTLKAGRTMGSLASMEGPDRAVVRTRFVPRDAAHRSTTIRVWREATSGRLERVEIETPSRRTSCVLEPIREMEER